MQTRWVRVVTGVVFLSAEDLKHKDEPKPKKATMQTSYWLWAVCSVVVLCFLPLPLDSHVDFTILEWIAASARSPERIGWGWECALFWTAISAPVAIILGWPIHATIIFAKTICCRTSSPEGDGSKS